MLIDCVLYGISGVNINPLFDEFIDRFQAKLAEQVIFPGHLPGRALP
jgi:hypothetical protein